MPWVVVAAVAGAAINSDSSRSAANKQGKATDAALEESKRQFDLTREDNIRNGQMIMDGEEEMYRRVRADNIGAINRGEAAGKQLAWRMGLGGEGTGEAGGLNARYKDFTFNQDDPSYQWRMSEGLRGVNNSAAAQGNLLSGAALKAITKYGQDAASQEYGAAYGRYSNDRAYDGAAKSDEYNRYMGIQGAGQTAVNTVAGIGSNAQNQISSAIAGMGAANQRAGENYTNSVNSLNTNQANANASATMARANQWTSGLNSLANMYGSYKSNQNNNSLSNYGGGYKNNMWGNDIWSQSEF